MSKRKIEKIDAKNLPHKVFPLDNKVQRKDGESILTSPISFHKQKEKSKLRPILTQKQKEILFGSSKCADDDGGNGGHDFQKYCKGSLEELLNDTQLLREVIGDEEKMSAFIVQRWRIYREKGGINQKSLATFSPELRERIRQKAKEFLLT